MIQGRNEKGDDMTILHSLPPLGYAYDALEPYIDKETMLIHHTKHHQAYVDKLNAALEGHEGLQGHSAEDLLRDLGSVPEPIRTAVRNHGGGHANHSFFWKVLKKDVAFAGPIAKEIDRAFGSYDGFKKQLTASATGVFGSGWTWLVLDKDKLRIVSTQNQDSPLSQGLIPLLCIDLWEHAYYLKYRNRRAEYIEAFFHVINWDRVNALLAGRGR